MVSPKTTEATDTSGMKKDTASIGKGIYDLIKSDGAGSSGSSIMGNDHSSSTTMDSSFEKPSVIENETKSIDKVESEIEPDVTVDENNTPEPEKLLSFDKEEEEDKNIFEKIWDNFKKANKATPEETAQITQKTDKPNMIGKIKMPSFKKRDKVDGSDLNKTKEQLKKNVAKNDYSVLNENDYKIVNEAVPGKQYVVEKPVYKPEVAFGEDILDVSLKDNKDTTTEIIKKEEQEKKQKKQKEIEEDNRTRLEIILEYKKYIDNYANEVVGRGPDGHEIKRSDIQSGIVVQDKDGNSKVISFNDLQNSLNKEVAYEQQIYDKQKNNVTVDVNDPDFYNSMEYESVLSGLGLEIDPESAKQERIAALAEGRNPDLGNVAVRKAKPDPANIVRNYANGIITDATDALFQSNHILRDRVVDLINKGKTPNEIMKDHTVRDQLGLAKNRDVINMLMAATTPVVNAAMGQLGRNIINSIVNKNNRFLEFLKGVSSKKDEALLQFVNEISKQGAIESVNVKALVPLINAATAAGQGASTLGSLIGAATTKRDKVTPDIEIDSHLSTYDPENIITPDYKDATNAKKAEVDPVKNTPISLYNISFNSSFPQEWRDVLNGPVTLDNVKTKQDYFNELIDKGLIEQYIEEKNMGPEETDAFYESLIEGQNQLTGTAFDYLGEAFSDAQWIENHPENYSYEQRTAAKNVLDKNQPNYNKDEVASAYKNGEYIEKKLEAARFNNAFKNRKNNPELWDNLFNEYTEEQKRSYLDNIYYESDDRRFFGADVSNWITNNLDQAKNAAKNAKKELIDKVKEITDWEKLSKTKGGQAINKAYNYAKNVVGNIIATVANPLEMIDKCIEYGIQLPLKFIGDSLEKAGNKTVGNWVNNIYDKIKNSLDNVQAAITGNADVNNKKQYEIALTTKQARGLTSGSAKIIEGVMSGNGAQVARGTCEILVSLDRNIDANKVKNAANQALEDLGFENDEDAITIDADYDSTSEENETLKKKKKKTNDIPVEEGITQNAAGFNSGLGADTIKYLYNKYGKNITA